jgi:hypothetical protein
MGFTYFAELHLAFQRWTNYPQGGYFVTGIVLSLIAILFGVAKYLTSSPTPKVPILLSDEIGNARKRALEYCFNSRAVMAKGYAKVCIIVFVRVCADGLVQK